MLERSMIRCPYCGVKMRIGDTFSPKFKDIAVVASCPKCKILFAGFLIESKVLQNDEAGREYLKTYGENREDANEGDNG